MGSRGLVENLNLNLQAPEESIESCLGVNNRVLQNGDLKESICFRVNGLWGNRVAPVIGFS